MAIGFIDWKITIKINDRKENVQKSTNMTEFFFIAWEIVHQIKNDGFH